MRYKSMVLELLEQHPVIHNQLRSSRTLLSTIDRLATGLKSSHEEWMSNLRQSMQGSSESEITSTAMELAIEELESVLSSDSLTDGDDQQVSDHPIARE
jgi:hypothetical protein